jgi:dihydroflavonol-4-reductase
MQTVITGASGLLGGNLAITLLQSGHKVRATRRGQTQVAHLRAFPIEWVDADLAHPEALGQAFRGADAVFHCAAQVSIRKAVTPLMRTTNVEGTRHVLQAARAAGVGRLIHCSTVGAIGLSTDGKPCTEEARWNFAEHGMDDGYVTTKRQSQDLVEAAAADGLDAVIVNPTYMLGPYDIRPSSGKLIVDVARGKAPGYSLGINNFVDVRDVARGMLLAWEKGRRGEKYILGGENLTYKDIMERIAREAGVAPPSRQVPRWLGRLVGLFGDVQERLSNREPLLNSVTMGYAYCTIFQFSSQKAQAELGYRPGPLEPAIRDALRFFREQQMI